MNKDDLGYKRINTICTTVNIKEDNVMWLKQQSNALNIPKSRIVDKAVSVYRELLARQKERAMQ